MISITHLVSFVHGMHLMKLAFHHCCNIIGPYLLILYHFQIHAVTCLYIDWNTRLLASI